MKTLLHFLILLTFTMQLNAQNPFPFSNNEATLDTIAFDAGLTFIDVSPKFDDTTTFISKELSVTVRIKNYSDSAISNFQLEYILLNWSYYQPKIDTFTNTLNIGDSIDFTFTKKFHSPIGYYTIQAIVKLNTDINHGNDTIRRTYFGYNDYQSLQTSKGNHFWLGQNRPNPAISQAQIDYFIPTEGIVEFRLYNVLGETLIANSTSATAGKHTINVNTDKLSDGVYYYTLRFNNQQATQRMIIGHR